MPKEFQTLEIYEKTNATQKWQWSGIIVNLLLVGSYFDIALRDLGLGLGAIALARLAMEFDRPVRVEGR